MHAGMCTDAPSSPPADLLTLLSITSESEIGGQGDIEDFLMNQGQSLNVYPQFLVFFFISAELRAGGKGQEDGKPISGGLPAAEAGKLHRLKEMGRHLGEKRRERHLPHFFIRFID